MHDFVAAWDKVMNLESLRSWLISVERFCRIAAGPAIGTDYRGAISAARPPATITTRAAGQREHTCIGVSGLTGPAPRAKAKLGLVVSSRKLQAASELWRRAFSDVVGYRNVIGVDVKLDCILTARDGLGNSKIHVNPDRSAFRRYTGSSDSIWALIADRLTKLDSRHPRRTSRKSLSTGGLVLSAVAELFVPVVVDPNGGLHWGIR